MSCECGHADECDGEYAVHYPLQDGGRCAVEKCKSPSKPSFSERDFLDVDETIRKLKSSNSERGYSGYYVTLDEKDRDMLCKAWPKLRESIRSNCK